MFDVAFVSVGGDRSRMYLSGKRLGDELTDNSYDDDGYRFHDVMHLANCAHLGWSPVLRKLLKRKRKSSSKTDEVEDGARAQIVEELVLKAIHSEGDKSSDSLGPNKQAGLVRNFPTRGTITFRLLKSLRAFVAGLEVEKNKYWEWEDAIFEGAEVFYKLRQEEQGTVTVNLEKRSLTFSPDVCVDLKGAVAGLGSAWAPLEVDRDVLSSVLTESDRLNCRAGALLRTWSRGTVAAKRAILDSLGFESPSSAHFQMLSIKILDANRVCVKASSEVLERMRANSILAFKLAFTTAPPTITCTAIAVADFQDVGA